MERHFKIAGEWPESVPEVGGLPLKRLPWYWDFDSGYACTLRRQAPEAWRGATALRRLLAHRRTTAGVGGTLQVRANAAVVGVPRRGGALTTLPLFGGAGDAMVATPDLALAANWHPADTSVLDDIGAVLAPGMYNVSSRLLAVVRASDEPLVPPSSPPGTFGYLAVAFGGVGSLALNAAAAAARGLPAHMTWEAPLAGSDAGTAGGSGRAMAAALAATPMRHAAWVAWYAEDTTAVVPARPGAPPPLVALYALTGIPSASPASATRLPDGVGVGVAFQQLASHPSLAGVALGYFPVFPTFPREAAAVGITDALTQLRGIDAAVVAAAAAVGYKAHAANHWLRSKTGPPADGRLQMGPPPPISYQLLVNDMSGVPGSNPRTDIVWLNTPTHTAPGVLFDPESVEELYDDPELGVGWLSTAIVFEPPPLPTPAAAAEPQEMAAALRVCVAAAQLEVGVVMTRAEADEEADASAVPPTTAAAMATMVRLLATAPPAMFTTAGDLPPGQSIALAFPGGGLTFPPPPGVTDMAAYLAPLLTACAPASFGRGTEAVLDAAVRRALALDAPTVATDWHPDADGVCAAVQRALGAAMPPLRPVLGKVNVYGPGDFFAAHADTLRMDTMVGTLVVCLPTPHAGGDLVLCHAGTEVRTHWGPGAGAGRTQWVAFYSDVEHEVTPVTAGYRVTLTYDLYADTSRPAVPATELEYGPGGQLAVVPRALPATAVRSCPVADAAEAAVTNPAALPHGGYLGIFLSHAYPISAVGCVDDKLLKGADAVVWRALRDAGCAPALHQVHTYTRTMPPATVAPNDLWVYRVWNRATNGWGGDDSDAAAAAAALALGDAGGGAGPHEMATAAPSEASQYVLRTFMPYAVHSGGDGAEPPWETSSEFPAGTSSVQLGVLWLNNPSSAFVGGTFDHVRVYRAASASVISTTHMHTHTHTVQIMGNWPSEMELYYTSVAILVRRGPRGDTAWLRRAHAVALHAANAAARNRYFGGGAAAGAGVEPRVEVVVTVAE